LIFHQQSRQCRDGRERGEIKHGRSRRPRWDKGGHATTSTTTTPKVVATTTTMAMVCLTSRTHGRVGANDLKRLNRPRRKEPGTEWCIKHGIGERTWTDAGLMML
jgi:hypothetical protein